MSYIVELKTATSAAAYVLAQAATCDDARALVDAQLWREDIEDAIIVAVHPVH